MDSRRAASKQSADDIEELAQTERIARAAPKIEHLALQHIDAIKHRQPG